MEDKPVNSKMGPVDRAWDAAKTYMSSNTINKYNGIIKTETTQRLGEYLQKPGRAAEYGIDKDTTDDPNLLKYTIKEFTPGEKNQEELSDSFEVYLISDDKGHDIGILKITEKGTVFELSDSIQKANEKGINSVANGNETIESILKEKYDINSMGDLAKKIAKNEKIVISSQKQALDDYQDECKKRGLSAEDQEQHEDPEEEKAINAIPADMRSEVIAMCREKNISIKEVLVVDCAKCLSEEMTSNEAKIKADGGPVILVQAHNKGAELEDDVYMFQDGQELPNSEKDKARVLELMNQHKGEGNVAELDDTKQDEVKKEIENLADKAEEQLAMLEKGGNTPKQKEELVGKIHEDLDNGIKSTMQYYDYIPGKEVVEQIEETHDDVQEQAEETMSQTAKPTEGRDRLEEAMGGGTNPHYE